MVKSTGALFYEEEQQWLRAIHLITNVFVWILEVYKMKRNTEMVDRDQSFSFTIPELRT